MPDSVPAAAPGRRPRTVETQRCAVLYPAVAEVARPAPTRAIPDVVARVGVERDPVEVLPDAFDRVSADALPVVTTTWALSRFPLERRLRFLHRLDEAAGGRAA